jgi:hypothetical protein
MFAVFVVSEFSTFSTTVFSTNNKSVFAEASIVSSIR